MLEPQQNPSPPSSTSLPEHWSFVPPPTDGPNTRARRERGQLPYSGTAAPLPVELVAKGPTRIAGGNGAVEQYNAWDTQAEQQYWCTAGPSTTQGETFFAIDPSLAFDASYTSVPYRPASELAPLPSSTTSSPYRSTATPSQREDRRLFSSTSVIDHGSPPLSPVTGTGITKEEWLRLGGFTEEGETAAPAEYPAIAPEQAFSLPPAASLPQPAYVEDQFALPPTPFMAAVEEEPGAFASYTSSGPSHSAHPLLQTDFPPPSPTYPLPPPPASAPPASSYVLPPPPPPPAGIAYPLRIADKLPVPPSLHQAAHAPVEDRLPSRAADRSASRRAPSPAITLRTRPAPYPTSSPRLPDVARNLTPVSTALATYHHYPVPAAPPAPAEPAGKRKSHGRRTSANHIPRPRNAFILFRSHAVSTGLIPRSMGITDHKNISQIVGSVWRGLSDEERKKWDELAEEEKRQHRERYPDYTFRPKQKGQRAPVGQGKKAKARAAREAAERQREDAMTAAAGRDQDGDGDDEGEGEGDDGSEFEPVKPRPSRRKNEVASSTPRKTKTRSWAGDDEQRNQRRMELIGQAVLEGEDEERILERVDAEMNKEDEALGDLRVDEGLPPSPAKPTRRSPAKSSTTTPRKTRSAVQQHLRSPPNAISAAQPGDIVVGSPASSSSTLSPARERSSPYSSAVVARRGGPLPSSPASSASPSPKRMQQTGPLRGAGSPPTSASGRHPLSRSHPAPREQEDHDLPAARRGKKMGAYAGLGIEPSTFVLPPTPSSDTGPSPTPTLYQAASPDFTTSSTAAFEQPLFSGPADNRNFSLGRWELRRPSTMAGSRREQLAQQEEEAQQVGSTSGWLDRAAGGASGGRLPSFAIDTKEFLAESGLEGAEDGYFPSSAAHGTDAWEVASTVSGPASSVWSGYEPSLSSVATTVSHSPRKQPLFRREPTLPSAMLASAASGGDPFCSPYSSTFPTAVAEQPADLFHFGSVDLFAKPPPALASSRSTSTSTEHGVGLGIGFGEQQRRQ